MRQPTISLTQDQIEFFQREGYLAIGPISEEVELAWMREKYDQMFSRRSGRNLGDQFDLAGTDEEGKEQALPQILNPEKYAPEFADTLMRANAMAIARQLIGAPIECHGAHAIYKPPRIGAATPWHQDEAYWDPTVEYPCSISIWVPLQEATIENGCMWFVPRSHRLEVLPHRHINNDPRIHGLELLDSDSHTSGAVACPLPPGGATIHPSRTLHHTGPNRSDVPRRAYILGAGLPPVKRAVPRRFPWLEVEKSAHALKRAAASSERTR